LKGGYKDEEAYESAVKKAIRDNDKDVKKMVKAFANGDFSSVKSVLETVASRYGISESLADEIIDAEYNYYKGKITDAAKALKEGKTSEYKDIVRDLRERYRGVCSQDDIVNTIKTKSLETTEDSPEIEEVESVYETWQINSALEIGDTETATAIVDDLVRVKTENYLAKAKAEAEKDGKKFNENTALKEAEKKARSSVKSSITSHWKPLYKEAYKNKDSEEMLRIRQLLLATGVYGRTSELLDTVKGWLKD
jgi:flavin-dependent dehydrogenase